MAVGFLLLAAAGRAQSAHWDPPGGSLAVGATTSLQLVFDNCEPKETPVVPPSGGLRIEYAGQSSRLSVINGEYTRSVAYTYAVLLSERKSADIRSFAVETDKGRVTVPAAHFEPTGATVGNQPLEQAANSHLEVKAGTVWAGEVFNLEYGIEAARSYYPDFGRGVLEWNSQPLVAEDWTKPEAFEVQTNGEARAGLAYHARAFARAPGSYRLNAANQIINLSVGVAGFGFFQQRQYQQFSVTSNTPTLEVRPLPPAPAGFSGAVGSFKLISKVVPAAAAVGEPVTWTLQLSGLGNWPDIAGLPAREISQDFRVIQPKAKRVLAEGKIFEATLSEDAVLVPTKPGTYAIKPVSFTYFDPRSGTYQTLTTEGATVTATAAAGSGAAPTAAVAPATAASSSRPPEAPATPSGLPRDPVTDEGSAAAPLDFLTLGGLALAPGLLLILGWVALAVGRARRSDPWRPRREARARLETILGQLRGSTGAETSPLLLSWQRETALLWGVPHAAPTPSLLSGPPADWGVLWAESDRVLYGTDERGCPSLPADWVQRAEAAAAASAIPSFAFKRFLLPRNLLPWFFCAVIAAAAGPVRAESAASLYRRGDFAGVEQASRAALAADPADWPARHNLSLALAQQNRWDEAAAYAAGALVQQPGNELVRWQFALACGKAGFVPAPLAGFLNPGPGEWLAGQASPAVWQRLLAASAWIGAAALGLLLLIAYGATRGRWAMPTALAVLGLAAALAIASSLGWNAYGEAADPRAVLIWRNGTLRSIPTEIEAGQKTVPLPAGSVALAGKTFLGWVRLDFENGQTGWVRKDETVGLWR